LAITLIMEHCDEYSASGLTLTSSRSRLTRTLSALAGGRQTQRRGPTRNLAHNSTVIDSAPPENFCKLAQYESIATVIAVLLWQSSPCLLQIACYRPHGWPDGAKKLSLEYRKLFWLCLARLSPPDLLSLQDSVYCCHETKIGQ